ncbi:MAG TPA: hypothetical protein VLM85_09920 [Polyangiaceae bacterium]|nr:hypothetical protein [Polyangiaceae bacterium]
MFRYLVAALALASCRPAVPAADAPDARAPPAAPAESTLPIASESAQAQPADSSAPFVANHALMLAIADGNLSFASLVDPRAGVVLIDHSGDPSGGGRGAPRAPDGVRCGSTLTALLDHWRSRLADARTGLRATYAEAPLTCRTAPDPACVWRGLSEWSPTVHFLFRAGGPRGLVLRAIVLEDELGVDPETVAAKRSRILPAVARLEAGGCAR